MVILGTTGEASTLSYEEKEEVMAVTREELGGKMPIVVGTGKPQGWRQHVLDTCPIHKTFPNLNLMLRRPRAPPLSRPSLHSPFDP